MALIRETWLIYRENILKILLVGMTMMFPIQWAYLIISNFFYVYFWSQGVIFWGQLFHALLILVTLSLVQLPFIQLALQDMEEAETTLGRVFGSFLQHAFPVYLTSLVYVLLVTVGVFILVIPGLIVMVLFYLFPYAVVIEGKKGLQSLTRAFQLAKSHFFTLSGILIGFGIIEWLITEALLFVIFQFTTRYLVAALFQMFLNMLFIPFLVFVLTIKYTEWSTQRQKDVFEEAKLD